MPDASPTPEGTEQPKNEGGITLAQYNQVRLYMSYEDVCKILGEPDELVFKNSDTHIPSIPGLIYITHLYEWKGAGASGAYARIGFLHGIVYVMEQKGLK